LTYTNTLFGDNAYPTYPDYVRRANFVVAITLLHELAHAVEFLRFNGSSDLTAQHIKLDRRFQPLAHPDGLADPDSEEAACAEMGYELEARLFGGMTISCFNLAGEEYRFFEQISSENEEEEEEEEEEDDDEGGGFPVVMPVFGLGLEDLGYMRNWPRSGEKQWLIPMRWIKWWWSRANLDLLSNQGPQVLPPPLDNGEYWDGEDSFKNEVWAPRMWPYVGGG
jgi:hypothetical protein